ncbi:hypothetical protein NP233_g8114 [Leucocoprinus birnbaumii]|uniref:Caleosin n=1 Tax=Leucocoprinus birnbaumii TaxID=56174 RepID=A0AAD5VTE5_9AGAR|nr:hypothetical protein NP233_g8114 [Leucocoprinus birnbaumii]
MVAPAKATEIAPGNGWSEDSRSAPDSELQQHVAFFDRDKDGIIWPIDTFDGLRKIGFGYFWIIFGGLAIHLAFSWLTWGTWLPDPYFRLKVNRMHKVSLISSLRSAYTRFITKLQAKHGSDTEIYTGTGQFDPDRFDYMWFMYTEEPHTHITFLEVCTMVRGDYDPFDWFGWMTATIEWVSLMVLLDKGDGRMSKEDVKGV